MSRQKLAEDISVWIREKVLQANCAGAVFGLSGGVDSAVVGALCKRAFPQHCLGLIMPCFSDRNDIVDAEMVAEKFDITTTVVTLDGVYQTLREALPAEGFDPSTKGIAEANLKPRLRMLTLYYFANRLSYLVVGTSNRSEIAVGYFTKYGDGGVDIMPLGNLVKGEVRELARQLGVPEEIIRKPASGGLWPGQTDEGEMGVTYDEIDRYLMGGEVAPEASERIESMARRTTHKRAFPASFPGS